MNDFDLKKYLVENKLTKNSQLAEKEDSTVDALYNKIINYMENNYSEYDIIEDDITTILNDVLKAKYTPEMFRAILKKIRTESEYNLKD